MALNAVEREMADRLSAARIFGHVEKLCEFGPRTIGSDGDEGSIKYLQEHIASYDADCEIEEFEIAVARNTSSRVRVLAPEERSFRCVANYRSPPSPPGGIMTDKIIDVGVGREEDYRGKDVAGGIVLAAEGGIHSVPKAELPAKMGAAACIWICGRPGGLTSTWGLAQDGSSIPVVSISYEDGEFLRGLLTDGALTLALQVDTQLETGRGRHVVGVVRGQERPDEVCVLCAHRETVPDSPGANDNASGVAVVLEVLKAAASCQPRRTIWGILTTGEEGGGIGMRAFAAANPARMAQIRAVINLDVVGSGPNLCIITEGRWPDRSVMTSGKLNRVLLEAASDLGYHLARSISGMGLADTEPFIDAGVPGAWMCREMTDMGYIHTADDLPKTIDINSLKVAADIVMVALARVDQGANLDES